jgi:transcriptional regulator with XRE-family HTH domain
MGDKTQLPPGTGARIKARRQELGMTQAQVADRVAEKVGRRYRENWLAQIERGNASLLLNAAIALADVLTMSMDAMFGRQYGMPDIVLEADGTTSALEITQPVSLDDALAPVEGTPQDGAAAPIPLAAGQRRRGRGAARQPRT